MQLQGMTVINIQSYTYSRTRTRIVVHVHTQVIHAPIILRRWHRKIHHKNFYVFNKTWVVGLSGCNTDRMDIGHKLRELHELVKYIAKRVHAVYMLCTFCSVQFLVYSFVNILVPRKHQSMMDHYIYNYGLVD